MWWADGVLILSYTTLLDPSRFVLGRRITLLRLLINLDANRTVARSTWGRVSRPVQ